MAHLIKPDGTIEVLKGEGKNGELTLKQIQSALGGYFEPYPSPNPISIEGYEYPQGWFLLNEDGVRLGLPMNPYATSLWRAARMFGSMSPGGLRGNVLIVSHTEIS